MVNRQTHRHTYTQTVWPVILLAKQAIALHCHLSPPVLSRHKHVADNCFNYEAHNVACSRQNRAMRGRVIDDSTNFSSSFSREGPQWMRPSFPKLSRPNCAKKPSYREYSARQRSLRRSRSFRFTDVGTNRKPVCDYLLVKLTHAISHSFPVITQSSYGLDMGCLSLRIRSL